jgi:hypothetical protein
MAVFVNTTYRKLTADTRLDYVRELFVRELE